MSARPFTLTEISLLESHLLQHGRYRDRMLIIAGTRVVGRKLPIISGEAAAGGR